jgi:hypothetical protein
MSPRLSVFRGRSRGSLAYPPVQVLGSVTRCPGDATPGARAVQLREHAAKFRALVEALADDGFRQTLRGLADQCEQLAEFCETVAQRK